MSSMEQQMQNFNSESAKSQNQKNNLEMVSSEKAELKKRKQDAFDRFEQLTK